MKESDERIYEINTKKIKDENNELLKNNIHKTAKTEPKFNTNFNFVFFKKGSTYVILVDKQNRPLLSIGPQWNIFLLLFIIITGIFIFLFLYFFKSLNIFLKIVGILIYLAFLFGWLLMFFCDPGIPKEVDEYIANKEKDKYIYCVICRHWITRESESKHCSLCDVCYEEHEYHCSFLSKCIAKKNYKYFYTFIIVLCLILIYLTFVFVYGLEKKTFIRKSGFVKNKFKKKINK